MIRIVAKCVTLVLLVGLLLLGSVTAHAADPPKPPSPQVEFVPGEIIVKFRARVRPQALGTDDQGRLTTDLPFLNVLSARHGVTGMDMMVKTLPAEPRARATLVRKGLNRIYKLKVDEKADLAPVIKAFKSSPYVEYAEPNYIAHVFITPNDPYWSSQWGMTKIEAPAAWDITTGSDSVTIAIVDTGVDLFHPDISGKLASGYDFVNDDNTPQDDHGHGTHVAGIAAAKTDNSTGVAGLAWGAEIMPVKVLDDYGNGGYEDVASGIIFAANNGADIINLSLGGSASSSVLEEAVEYAHDLGCVIVAATGNNNSAVNYPARYPEVIAVAATDSNDQRASFSNYGPEVDVAAPGVNIRSTYWWGGSTYEWMNGTSQASPHVAGLAALIWSVNPDLSNTQVESIIKQTADDLGAAGRDNYYGFGRINARRALEATAPSLDTPTSMGFLADPVTDPFSQTLRIGNGAMYGTLQWSAVENPDVTWLSIGPPTSGDASPPSPGELAVSVDKDVAGQGTHSTAIRLTSPDPYIQNSPQDINVTLVYTSSIERTYLPLITMNAGNWIDITADSTILSLGDDDAQRIALPFDFRFYGTTYNELWVSSNGLVSFANGYTTWANGCLPSTSTPNNAIYAFWDDLRPADGGGGGTIYAKQVDSETFVVEWHEVSHYGSSGHETFEIILKQDDTISLQYQALSSISSATVGVENAGGTAAQQYWCNGSGNPLYNGLSIEFTTP
ncbi:MAG TPA: peptidase S8 [Anaerolineae bacterium]|nr:peptidase S8 [Anaerolineae bacterium]